MPLGKQVVQGREHYSRENLNATCFRFLTNSYEVSSLAITAGNIFYGTHRPVSKN